MNAPSNHGGPAFPVHAESHNRSNGQLDGMTLRDYFAAKAMHGALVTAHGARSEQELAEYTAHIAYLIADTMLAARSSK